MKIRVQELSARLNLDLHGDGEVVVERVAPLQDATADSLSFLGDRKYRHHLSTTRAGALILPAPDADVAPDVPVLVSANPYLAYARAAAILHPEPEVDGGIHPSAVVDPSAEIDSSAWIGPQSVVEAGVRIGARVLIGPGCILGERVEIGADSRLLARVTVLADCVLGERALIKPGAVIGSPGFGFARDGERWVRMPQVGRVVLGDDVEIGANTTVDRGAIADTRIAAGVKLDNNIQVGHNVEIGEHSAIAANSGISGSTRIGRCCTVAGAVGMAGHLEIADNVHFTGMAMVTRSLREPGVYSSGIPAMPNAEWHRVVVWLRRLEQLAKRVKTLEATVARADSNREEQVS